MKWESLIEGFKKSGILQEKEAEQFINIFMKGDLSSILNKKKINVDFVAYLFLRYGYCKEIYFDPNDIKIVWEKLHSVNEEVFKYFIGIDRGFLIDRLNIMKKSTGTLFICPFMTVSMRKREGQTHKWQIRFFAYFLYKCLKENLEDEDEIKKLIIRIMYYFPPFVQSRRVYVIKNNSTYDNDIRKEIWDSIRKYLKINKEGPSDIALYNDVKGDFKKWKMGIDSN